MNIYKTIIYASERKFPAGNAGGIRTHFMAKLLKLNAEDVHVVSVGDVSLNSQYNFKYDGINFLNIGLPFNKYFNYLLNGIRMLKEVKKITSNKKSNDFLIVIYSTNIFFVLIFILFYDLKNNICFDIVENFGKEKFSRFSIKYFLFRKLYSNIYTKSKFNFVISRQIENDFKIFNKSLFIPSIIDPRQYSFKKRILGEESLQLVYFGSPFGKENVELMLESVIKILNSTNHKLTLHFSGVEIDEFKKLNIFNELLIYLDKDIFIHGWVSHQELQKLIRDSHFLFFLREESYTNLYNFPTKLAESFAFGLPCVCNLIGPYAEFLNQTNSVIVSDSTILNTVSSLESLFSIDNEIYLQICQNARRTAEEHFNYSNYAQTMGVFFNENS